MTTPAYPAGLPLPLASKTRNQPASFSMSDPRRGPGYAQKTGTDVPVFWQVQWRFDRWQAIQFQLWFRDVIDSGLTEFTMPLKTEFGLITHTMRFLPDSLLPASHDGGDVISYTATVSARAQVIPAEYLAASDLIVSLPSWQTWGGTLDQAIAEMP